MNREAAIEEIAAANRDGRPANLDRANLARAYLARANLEGANLARACLTGANIAGANLAGANLAGANLARARLAGANLDGANLAGANLEVADLAGARLAGAYLAGASLAGACLEGANLDGAAGIATAEEEAATWRAVCAAVVAAPERLDMDTWHGPSWDPSAVGDCGTTHCLAGWAQAQSTDPTVRAMEAGVAGSRLLPRHARLFYGETDDVMEICRKEIES